jgi:RNA-binding protein Luc7-like 2
MFCIDINLSSLMGFNRNRDRDDQEIKDFRDPRVCKFYLLGMCPHGKRPIRWRLVSLVSDGVPADVVEMFVNTKADTGPCEKIHSDPLRYEFERNGDLGMFDNEVEREFVARISDIDRTIKVTRPSPSFICTCSPTITYPF